MLIGVHQQKKGEKVMWNVENVKTGRGKILLTKKFNRQKMFKFFIYH